MRDLREVDETISYEDNLIRVEIDSRAEMRRFETQRSSPKRGRCLYFWISIPLPTFSSSASFRAECI